MAHRHTLRPARMKVGVRLDEHQTRLPPGWWGSRKYDGIWVRWVSGKLFTQSGILIQGPEARAYAARHQAREPIDGELWSPKGRSVAVNALHGQWDPSLRVTAFDLALPNVPFERRIHTLWQLADREPGIEVATFFQLNRTVPEHTLHTLLDHAQAQGWEGFVLRDPASPYRPGLRDRRALKLKPWSYTQVRVLSCQPSSSSTTSSSSSAGAKVCTVVEDGNPSDGNPSAGRPFKVMSYPSRGQRHQPGKTYTVRHFGRTATNLPEFPQFVPQRTSLITRSKRVAPGRN